MTDARPLAGKSAVITGGASGIGAAAVRAFVAAGARVLIGDRDVERGRALAAEFGDAAAFHAVDVSREADVVAMLDAAGARHGRVDCLWSNAGLVGELGRLEATTWEGYRRTFDVMFGGVLLGLKHAAPRMKAQGGGVILNTASIASLGGGYGPHLYTAAKHAVLGLTRTASSELGPHRVRVNAICPGGIFTPMNVNALGGGPQAEALLREYLAKMQAIPRPGVPEDVAALGVFLASDAAGFVNGAAWTVDGGAAASLPWNPMYEGTPG